MLNNKTEFKRPGGELARRPLHFFFVADCSHSMSGQKIQSLNHAIREALPHMQSAADDNPQAEVLIRAIRFSTVAEWHVATPTPIAQFKWQDLTPDSETSMGAALSLLAKALEQMSEDRGFAPVIVLVTDGYATDTFDTGLDALMKQRWGAKAVRIAIAIGDDADHVTLQKFIGNSERKPLQADNAEDLVKMIRWASTAPLQASAAPPSEVVTAGPAASTQGNVPLPAAPVPSGEDDVW